MKYPLHSAHSAKVALGGHESEVEKSTELNLASLGAKWHTREWKTSTPRVLFPWEKKAVDSPGLARDGFRYRYTNNDAQFGH